MKKVALVTGSSRGIGRGIAKALAENGYALCVNYIERKDMADDLVSELTKAGFEAFAYQCDVADKSAVNEMVDEIEKRFGPVSLLVNNAGIAPPAQIQDVTDEMWDRIFDVNLKGDLHTIQRVLPHMLSEKKGCIINISSIWGLHGGSCESVYSATKHGVIGLTKSLALELAPSNIRVNAIAPGVINTDMVKAFGEEAMESLKNDTPLGRLGEPEDIARAVLYLSEADFVTGQVLTVDGGFCE
ncbi:MAG: SDR family oxidoreductase [Clostridia bacterium]|nr:SDR family oxidoreductase [Clostridia bacterium]